MIGFSGCLFRFRRRFSGCLPSSLKDKFCLPITHRGEKTVECPFTQTYKTAMPAPLLLADNSFDTARHSWAGNEQRLIDCAQAAGCDAALVFCGEDGIVVPRSYRSKPGFDQACATLAADGLPVHVRLSGGGVVPQSPAVVNLYLARPLLSEQPVRDAEQQYLALCALLERLFAEIGIATGYQAVAGSFCDGRFNLAAGGRKIAGTAQYWQRRRGTPNGYTALLSAVILAGDAAALAGRANRFEAALGSSVRYRADACTAAAEHADTDAAQLAAVLRRLLAEAA